MISLSVTFFPPEILIGLATVQGSEYCQNCDEEHQFVSIHLGFLFFVINLMWTK